MTMIRTLATGGMICREDITDELRLKFKKHYSYLFTKFINTATVPKQDQPWNFHWIHKLEITPELLSFLPKSRELFPSSKADTSYAGFTRIQKTSIKQWMLPWTGNGKTKTPH